MCCGERAWGFVCSALVCASSKRSLLERSLKINGYRSRRVTRLEPPSFSSSRASFFEYHTWIPKPGRIDKNLRRDLAASSRRQLEPLASTCTRTGAPSHEMTTRKREEAVGSSNNTLGACVHLCVCVCICVCVCVCVRCACACACVTCVCVVRVCVHAYTIMYICVWSGCVEACMCVR